MAGPPKETNFTTVFFLLTQILTSFVVAEDFIYNGFQGASLHIDGSSNIHSNGLLQLTNITFQQIGHAFRPLPLKFNNSLSFSTTFAFAMYPQVSAISGHGIAFVITPSTNFTTATAGQYFGIFNSSNTIFAVELDTIQNLEFGDIDSNHVGVDVNSLTSIASASVGYYSDKEQKNQSLNLISGEPMQIWIDYDHEEVRINITISPPKSFLVVQELACSPLAIKHHPLFLLSHHHHSQTLMLFRCITQPTVFFRKAVDLARSLEFLY